jgi:hypothetical protein
MYVDPVPTSTAGIERQTPEKDLHAVPTPRAAGLGSVPKVEIVRIKNVPAPFLIPEHVVNVQLDTPADNILIYQVVDKQSGALVLQVPSAEVLSGIHQSQELLQRIASRGKASTSDVASAPVVKGQEKNNGSKL